MLILPAAALIGCGPTFVFPGGALEGEPQPPPASWSFAADISTIQLETRPGDPYSVNISCAVANDQLYISAGDSYTQWVENMDADPRVRVRIDGVLYDLRAERVTDPEEMRAFGIAWTAKLGFIGRDPTKLDEAFVYRLGPR